MSDWIPLGNGMSIRRASDGQVVGQRVIPMRRTMDAKQAIRRGEQRPSDQDNETGSLRLIASVPADVAYEMNEKCGRDPEKRLAFLRDHPEHLLTHKGAADLPPTRKHFFMGG